MLVRFFYSCCLIFFMGKMNIDVFDSEDVVLLFSYYLIISNVPFFGLSSVAFLQ